MRSNINYVTRLGLLSLLALSLAGCTLGGEPTPTQVAPVFTSTPLPVPTSTTISVPTSTLPIPTSTTMPSSTAEPANTPTSGPTPLGAPGQNIVGKPMVESVEVQVLESFPVQVSVNVKGNVPDACTRLDEISPKLEGNTFNVGITTSRPADMACAAVLTPFDETFSLDVKGLKKGTYTVNIYGVTDTFELTTDN